MTNDVASQVASLKDQLRLPVIVAPMFLVSGPDLVVEACRAGLMGSLPGPNGRTIDDLRAWFTDIATRLDAARAAGERPAPWAFNMITHQSYGRFDDEIALVQEFRPGLSAQHLEHRRRHAAMVDTEQLLRLLRRRAPLAAVMYVETACVCA